MAKKKPGNIRTIIRMTATLLPRNPRVKIYVGIPMAADPPKQMSCFLLSPNAIFDLMRLKSLGTLE